MYVPKHFDVSDFDEIVQFVAQARSADLVTINPSGSPDATLMPCTWDLTANTSSEYGSLVMHMARANQQWKSVAVGAKGLAIIRGPEAYVSPSNYEGKNTDHKVVPTWNYQSVHLSGTVEVSEDIEQLRKIVVDLTDFHEAEREKPWHVAEAEPRYIEAQLKGIVAVILHVEKVEAKYKLSQNRSITDRKRVIADLGSSDKSGAREISAAMEATLQSEE